MIGKNTKTFFIGWFICSIGAIFYCYEFLLRIEPSVIVSDLMRQFGVAATGFGVITAAYYYAYTPMQLFVGILVDRYGTRLMIGLGIICCSLGSFLFNMALSVYVATFARFLIGFGSAFAFVGVLKLAAEWLPQKYFAFFTGLTTSLGMAGGMFGDIFLVNMSEAIGYKNVLHLGTIAGVILIPIIFVFVHDTPNAKALPVRETCNFKELFQGLGKMFRSPQMWIIGIVANTLYVSLSAFAELWGIKFLQTVYNFPVKQASVACSMVFLGWLIGSPLSGWISDFIGSRKKILVIGGVISSLAMFVVVLKPFDISYLGLCFTLFLFGLFASTEIVCFAMSKEISPHKLAGTALAFTNFLVMVGGMILQPIIGLLLDLLWEGHVTEGVRIYSAKTYQIVFMIIPFVMAGGTLLGLKLKETLLQKY